MVSVCCGVSRVTETPPEAAASEVKVEDEDGGPDVKPELPLHVSIAKDVMERCVHLLSHPSMRVRLKVENFKSSDWSLRNFL